MMPLVVCMSGYHWLSVLDKDHYFALHCPSRISERRESEGAEHLTIMCKESCATLPCLSLRLVPGIPINACLLMVPWPGGISKGADPSPQHKQTNKQTSAESSFPYHRSHRLHRQTCAESSFHPPNSLLTGNFISLAAQTLLETLHRSLSSWGTASFPPVKGGGSSGSCGCGGQGYLCELRRQD